MEEGNLHLKTLQVYLCLSFSISIIKIQTCMKKTLQNGFWLNLFTQNTIQTPEMERASPKTPNLTPHIPILLQNLERYIIQGVPKSQFRKKLFCGFSQKALDRIFSETYHWKGRTQYFQDMQSAQLAISKNEDFFQAQCVNIHLYPIR